jgi:hypothetical protein
VDEEVLAVISQTGRGPVLRRWRPAIAATPRATVRKVVATKIAGDYP